MIAVLAADKPSLTRYGVAVGVNCRRAEDPDRICNLVEAQHTVVGNVAPDEIAPGREAGGPLCPSAALVRFLQARRSGGDV
jgi:hypothetical protein